MRVVTLQFAITIEDAEYITQVDVKTEHTDGTHVYQGTAFKIVNFTQVDDLSSRGRTKPSG